MNTATEILLLMSEDGKQVPGGEVDVRSRGGVFGPQGYGGGIFDGSMAFGSTDEQPQQGQTVNPPLLACRSNCTLQHPPGSGGLAPCLDMCDAQYGQAATKNAFLFGILAGAAAGGILGLGAGYANRGRSGAGTGLLAGTVFGVIGAAIGVSIYRNRAA